MKDNFEKTLEWIGFVILFWVCFTLGFIWAARATTKYHSQAVTLIHYEFRKELFLVKIMGNDVDNVYRVGAEMCGEYLKGRVGKLTDETILEIVHVCSHPQFEMRGQ